MKRAVSISIGSSKRDKAVVVELLGEQVSIERIGTDGDMEKAAQLYAELDGKVDAFGVGGTDLGLMVDKHWYRLHSVKSLVRDVHQTPVADGLGLKTTLERGAARTLDRLLGDQINPRNALVMTATDRWGLSHGFVEQGYQCRFGDLVYSLDIPIILRSEKAVKRMAAVLMPIAGRIPFHWLYPTGESQGQRKPKGEEHFLWAKVIAGDCHYITRYMPDKLPGRFVVTNTTTQADMELFRSAGVKYVLTTTPVLDGRSFGTNMMEAALLAASGRKDPVDYSNPGSYFDELQALVDQIGMEPQLQEL
ncbi:MAG: hypothetical protein JXA25_13180 [Anaerolineales bacterium]|nr:hypothetical protein [Anaerolineales bacterium]